MALYGGVMGWILRGTRHPIKMEGISAHQVLKVIHSYGFRLGQHLHLYIPDPPPKGEEAVQGMLEVLLATNVIAGGPYTEKIDRVHDLLRASQPRLFDHEPKFFRVYRINEKQLNKLLETLDARYAS